RGPSHIGAYDEPPARGLEERRTRKEEVCRERSYHRDRRLFVSQSIRLAVLCMRYAQTAQSCSESCEPFVRVGSRSARRVEERGVRAHALEVVGRFDAVRAQIGEV